MDVPYTAPGAASEVGYYTVKRGDTLYKIASLYNTTVAELKRINNLTSDTLTIGQKLLVTELPTNQNIYIVQKGDTLYGIASKFSTTVEELKRLNNLTSNTLSIGQQLFLPTSKEDYKIYIVQKGDSLWAIAQKYNITVNELINLNNLTSLTLQIGDELKVPNIIIDEEIEDDEDLPALKTYTVQKGDTLWSIANSNNISVDKLKAANNLTSNLLSVGQSLIIPS